MPDVLPTINNEPPQGIQALLDTVYLWNPDVANDLIEKINVLLGTLENSGKIRPYSEIEAPVRQYMPCYDSDNVYVAARDLTTLPAQLDPSDWILIATKAPVLQAGEGISIDGNEISVTQTISDGAAAGSTAVQPGDLGTAAYAATTDFATAAQGGKADTAVQPGDLGTAAYAAATDFATAAQGALADTAIQSVKTINGNTITGSGNLVITSFASYPVAWPTTGTTKAFCDAIAADDTAVEGMAYLGKVTINDMPAGITNSEIQVEIISGTTATDKVILLTLSSGNVAPYRWQYTYWNAGLNVSGWINIGQQVNVDWDSSSGVTQILNKPAIPTVIDNYNSTSGTAALSANMGHDLNERLTSVEGRGRFLSTWNCATGLAGTNPQTSPYTYKSGDYFIVSAVGTTNYRPSGSQYVTGTASTVVETGTVAVNDTYQYDGSNWILLRNTVEDPLPPQTGNAGKVLTTDGTNAAWGSTVSPLEIRTTDTSVHGESTKLTFSTVVEGSTTNPIVMASSGSGQLIITAPSGVVFDGYTLMPRINANSRLGFDLLKWESIYVTRINNGGSISVPTVGGSMAVQVSSMPTAAATLVGQIYQFIGTTDQNYTNGYFYKCVSDGQDPATYSWTEVQLGGGNYLPLSGGMMTGPINFEGAGAYTMSVRASATNTTGLEFSSTYGSGMNPIIMDFGNNTIMNQADNTGSLGQPSYRWGRVCTTTLNNGNAIDVPTVAGKMAVQVSSMPTASYALEGQIYQFVGATDSTYTNGYFYKCVSDISDPETYSWAAVSVQAGGSGSVPTLTWYTVSTAGNTLTIADTSSAQLVKIYKNGLLLQPTEDYTISGTTLTTVGALVVGDKITTEAF